MPPVLRPTLNKSSHMQPTTVKCAYSERPFLIVLIFHSSVINMWIYGSIHSPCIGHAKMKVPLKPNQIPVCLYCNYRLLQGDNYFSDLSDPTPVFECGRILQN